MSNAEPGTKLPRYRFAGWDLETRSPIVLPLEPFSSEPGWYMQADVAELQAKLADTEFMRGAMQADLEAAGNLLGCDFDQVVVTLEERENQVTALTAEVARLRELIHHSWIHSGYSKCGFRQMTTEQKAMFEEILDAAALSDTGEDAEA